MVRDMDYKSLLKERARMGQDNYEDAAPLRWIDFRNREYLRDWYRRRAWPEHIAAANNGRSSGTRPWATWLSSVQGHRP
jgi:hypothetical protein